MLSCSEVFSLLPLFVQYNPNDRCLFLLKNFLRHCRTNNIQISPSLFRLHSTLLSKQSCWLPWDHFWNSYTVEQEWKWQRPVLGLQVLSRVWRMLLHAFIFVQFWKAGRLGENWLIKLIFQDDSSSRMNFQSFCTLKDRTETDNIQVENGITASTNKAPFKRGLWSNRPKAKGDVLLLKC